MSLRYWSFLVVSCLLSSLLSGWAVSAYTERVWKLQLQTDKIELYDNFFTCTKSLVDSISELNTCKSMKHIELKSGGE